MVCCLSGKVTTTAQFETTGGSMEWIGLVVFISSITYIVLLAGRNRTKGASPACHSWYSPRSFRKTGSTKSAQVLSIAVLFIFTATNTWAFDWAAGAVGAIEALRVQLAEERKVEQQKQLIEYQYKLESERIERTYQLERERAERTYQLERERTERERAEQERRHEVVRRQQKIAEDKKLQEVAETKRNAISTGTGFFIAPGGYLVTNHHVIEDATDFAVRDHKGRFYQATVIARDSNRDLALLKVNGAFPTLKITSSESVSKGQRVRAVGYPQISIQGNESKVTDGIISSFSGLQNDDNWFQISVPIQGGNSGGPLVTESGGVVGVVVATANVARFYKLTGNLPQNVNYAIKSKVLLDFLKVQNLQNFSASKAKISIDEVDASKVLVIAKNGLIDVSYTVSPEQRAQEERERTRTAAEETRRQREEKLAEQNRVANSQRLEVPSRLPPCKEYRHNCYGEMTRPNGEKYFGEFKGGKLNGQGKTTYPDGDTYIGHFKDDLPNGQGSVSGPNGANYVGEFKVGKPNGQGTMETNYGAMYVGNVKDGKPNGQGTLTFANGNKVVGEFKDEKNGQGTFSFANGNRYIGEFKDVKYNGQGTFTFANGSNYIGEFKDGKFNGQGTLTTVNGSKYVGEYKDDKPYGQGTFTFANGNKYVGEFKDGKRNGQGTLTTVNGSKYVGEYKDDKPYGQGVRYRADGSIQDAGVWEGGNFVRAE